VHKVYLKRCGLNKENLLNLQLLIENPWVLMDKLRNYFSGNGIPLSFFKWSILLKTSDLNDYWKSV